MAPINIFSPPVWGIFHPLDPEVNKGLQVFQAPNVFSVHQLKLSRVQPRGKALE